MDITRYCWSDCAHVQHVNDSGQPMGWVEVRDPVNKIVDVEPSFDCPACENPDVTQPGISIMPRVPGSTRQSAPAQTTTLNPVVSSFKPGQAMPPNPQDLMISTNDNPAVQQEMVNPYAMFDPYASAISANNHFDAQQAVLPYALTVLNNDYPAAQQSLDYLYHHQQVYNSAGLVSMPPFYGLTGPMDFAGTAPTSGPTNQLVTASINKHHSPKNTGKTPKHKPGKECPEAHPNCHWHYTDACHKNPATCTTALQAIKASFHAHGEWRHAPAGWNEAHKSCIRVKNPVMCEFHAELARSVFGSSCR